MDGIVFFLIHRVDVWGAFLEGEQNLMHRISFLKQ